METTMEKKLVVKEHIGTPHSWVCAFTIHKMHKMFEFIIIPLLNNAFARIIQVEGSGSLGLVLF
jgi:hypothetical protein